MQILGQPGAFQGQRGAAGMITDGAWEPICEILRSVRTGPGHAAGPPGRRITDTADAPGARPRPGAPFSCTPLFFATSRDEPAAGGGMTARPAAAPGARIAAPPAGGFVLAPPADCGIDR